MKNVKITPNKHSSMSMCPAILNTGQVKQQFRKMKQMQNRLERGMELALLNVACIIRDYLKGINIDLTDEFTYNEDLKVAIIPGMGAFLYAESSQGKNKNIDPRDGVIIVPNASSPKYVQVLAKYNPWPENFLPVKVGEKDAEIIRRRYTSEEMETIRKAIIKNSRVIENGLIYAGFRGIKVGKENVESVNAYNDLEYIILRKEFGIQEKARPHWRPAIRRGLNAVKKIQKNFMRYLETGDEHLFDVDEIEPDISANELKQKNLLQEKLAQSLNLKE